MLCLALPSEPFAGLVRRLTVTDYLDDWDAAVAAWLSCTEGQGIADVAPGNQMFGGKPPCTGQRSVAQLPFDFANLRRGEAGPLFPYGYELEAEATEASLALAEKPAEALEAGERSRGYSSEVGALPLQVVLVKYGYSVAEEDSAAIGVNLTVPTDEQVTPADADGAFYLDQVRLRWGFCGVIHQGLGENRLWQARFNYSELPSTPAIV